MAESSFFLTPALGLVILLAAWIARSFCNIGLLERPITLGFLWALFTGQWMPTIHLAIFFELFWLDKFFIGSYIPPFAGFPLMLLLPFAYVCGWQDPGMLVFPLILSLPSAYCIAWLENRFRSAQITGQSQLLQAINQPETFPHVPAKILTASFIKQTSAIAVIYIATLFWFIIFFLNLGSITRINVSWLPILAGSSIGGFLALRTPKAFALCLAILIVFTLIRIFC